MDPISIIGTAGAVANIIDVLGKIITTFAELRSQWQEADLTVLALETELAALNAALNKINDWAESCSDDPHHQLIMDLDRCVACCRLLIGKIDAELSQFQTTTENQLDVASKLRLLLKTKDFEHLQQMIGRQTAAMTLLLTACNATMLSKQKGLLQESTTRKVFKNIEDDTASLLVLRDTDSMVTRTAPSISSSRRSMVFDFDHTLFISRIYERWIRGSVKRSLLQQQIDGHVVRIASGVTEGSGAQKNILEKRCRDINSPLLREEKQVRRECKVLVVGDRSTARIVEHMKLASFIELHRRDVGGAHRSYKSPLPANVVRAAKALADHIDTHHPRTKTDQIWKHVKYIKDAPCYEAMVSTTGGRIETGFVDAAIAILGQFDVNEAGLPKPTTYFIKHIGRIAEQNCPSMAQIDTMQTEIKRLKTSSGILETRIQLHSWSLVIQFFDPRSHLKGSVTGDGPNQWIQYCKDTQAVIFTVDVSEIYTVDKANSPENEIEDTMMLFETIIHGDAYNVLQQSPIILVFHDLDRGEKKLIEYSLQFQKFDDGLSCNSREVVVEYLLAKFKALNRGKLDIYPHFVSSKDYATMREIIRRTEEEIRHSHLRPEGDL